MSTINKYSKQMVYERLGILTKLFFQTYPELSEFVNLVNIHDEKTNEFSERINFDANEIYKKLATQSEKNKLAKSDISLDKRVWRFIETNYDELIQLDKYYLYYYQNDIIEKDLHDMNNTYRKLKLK